MSGIINVAGCCRVNKCREKNKCICNVREKLLKKKKFEKNLNARYDLSRRDFSRQHITCIFLFTIFSHTFSSVWEYFVKLYASEVLFQCCCVTVSWLNRVWKSEFFASSQLSGKSLLFSEGCEWKAEVSYSTLSGVAKVFFRCMDDCCNYYVTNDAVSWEQAGTFFLYV